MQIAPAENFLRRATALRSRLAEEALDALLVTTPANIAYLSGLFASSAALIVGPEILTLISDSRYAQALFARAAACPFLRVMEVSGVTSTDQAIVEALAPLAGLRVGFEAGHLTVGRHQFLLETVGRLEWEDHLVATDGVVEDLRVRKDSWEIDRLRDGGGRLAAVAARILPRVTAGRTEVDIAAEIDLTLRRVGFERVAFDTIVASGPHAALPHGRAGGRRIEAGDLIVIDFGGVLDGYCTDMTRTVSAGPSRAAHDRLIAQVAEAQAAAFAAVVGDGAPETVDAAARGTLGRYGIGDAFTHGTGHGLGLEVHEAPRLTRRRQGHPEPPLRSGMVMTLEPGVYFPGTGGVRIEDDVLLGDSGAEWLTR